jgi:hypothetical protein
MFATVFSSDQARRACPANEDRTDYQVSLGNLLQDGVAVAEERRHIVGHDVVQVAQPIEI